MKAISIHILKVNPYNRGLTTHTGIARLFVGPYALVMARIMAEKFSQEGEEAVTTVGN